jgi:hypothetical protein
VFKDLLAVLKALEVQTAGPSDQVKLAGGQSSNTSLATIVTPMDSHAEASHMVPETLSTIVAPGQVNDVVVLQEMHGSNAPDGDGK